MNLCIRVTGICSSHFARWRNRLVAFYHKVRRAIIKHRWKIVCHFYIENKLTYITTGICSRGDAFQQLVAWSIHYKDINHIKHRMRIAVVGQDKVIRTKTLEHTTFYLDGITFIKAGKKWVGWVKINNRWCCVFYLNFLNSCNCIATIICSCKCPDNGKFMCAFARHSDVFECDCNILVTIIDCFNILTQICNRVTAFYCK